MNTQIESNDIIENDDFDDDKTEGIKENPKDVYMQLDVTIEQIRKYVDIMNIKDEKSVKRTFNFLFWLNQKTNFIINENDLIIPKGAIPSVINSYLYDKFNKNNKELIDRYYDKKDSFNNKLKYVLDKKKDISNAEVFKLVNLLVIKRSVVVWVEFGFNVGKEFGGKHPALILKCVGAVVIVAPLSSKTPKKINGYYVKVNNVMRFSKKKTRWININRIIPVSINRIDFNSVIGSVRGEVLDNISEAIGNCGIK